MDGYLDWGDDSSFLDKRPYATDPARTNPRQDRRGYLLDPWSNPYWILKEKGSARVVIYSFGPNRRRDTNTRPLQDFGEDDLWLIHE